MSDDTITFNEYEPPDVCDATAGLRYWRYEYWGSEAYPLGTAWVFDRGDQGVYLEYILVLDSSRRQGIGRALMLAIRDRWPTIIIGPAMTVKGWALCESLNPIATDGGDTGQRGTATSRVIEAVLDSKRSTE